MALLRLTYSGNVYDAAPAGTVDFPLVTKGGNNIPYLQRSHIHVYRSSDKGQTWVELGRPAFWDFDSTGTIVRLRASVTPDYVMVRRITPYQDLYTKFQDSSLLTADQLNEGEKFSMYVDQELFDLEDQGFWSKSDQVVDKPAQLTGNWPKDGKDKFIATTDAISTRLDPYVQDGVPPALGLPQKEQGGKQWFDTADLVQRFWDADAGAWVTLANTGPQGPPGPAISIKGVLPAGAWTPPVGAVNGDLWIAGGLITGFPGGDLQPGHGAQFNGTAWLDTGPLQGPAGTVTVGGTTTAAAGSPASVTNTGTPAAAVLQFVIPQGPPGPTGPPGPNTVVGNAPITSTLTGTRYDLTFDPIPLTTLP
jgi:hypothetical protein